MSSTSADAAEWTNASQRPSRELLGWLNDDALLCRLCGFDLRRKAPLNAPSFSRAFVEFAGQGMAARVHEAPIRRELGDALIGHAWRGATAIEARERPAKR